MMTSSNGNIFRVTGHLRGEFTGVIVDQYLESYSTHPWGSNIDICKFDTHHLITT